MSGLRRHRTIEFVTIRILTWNLQGRDGPDMAAVAVEIVDRRPDVVVLQEVQRGQAAALGEALGWAVTWRFKHWPVVVPPEGLAVLTPFPPRSVRTVHLATRLRFWSSRRRIAVVVVIDGPSGPLTIADTHLGAGVGDAERLRQAARLSKAVGGGDAVIVGDLNTHPGSIVLGTLAADGFRDAWLDLFPNRPGATNWPPGPRTGPPTQRLDYVLLSDDLWAASAELAALDEPAFERYGRLSDHLPLVVAIDATT